MYEAYKYNYLDVDAYIYVYTYRYMCTYSYTYIYAYTLFSGILNGDMSGFYKSNYSDADGNKKVMASTQFEVLIYA
jgi:hypothetical protein